MTYSLYLDDLRNPKTKAPAGEWVICRSFQEAVDLIETRGYPNYISFDHDLGEDELTGYDFCKWLVEDDMDNDWVTNTFNYNIHSANPVGSKNIEMYLSNYIKSKEELMGNRKIMIICGDHNINSKIMQVLEEESELLEITPNELPISLIKTDDTQWFNIEKHKPYGPIKKRGKGKYHKY